MGDEKRKHRKVKKNISGKSRRDMARNRMKIKSELKERKAEDKENEKEEEVSMGDRSKLILKGLTNMSAYNIYTNARKV